MKNLPINTCEMQMAPHDVRPSVSVVIPCYNAEKWIARAVASVLDQAGSSVELIVIEDGSTDRTVEVLKLLGSRLHWESGANRGACHARNRGLVLSTAEYVVFLDADDYIAPGSLAQWCEAASAHGADILFAPFAYEHSDCQVPGQLPREPVTGPNVLRQWLQGWFTPPCAILWRRSFIAGIGGWNTAALRNQDGELAMRALILGARPAVCRNGQGIYVQHDSADRISRRGGYDILASELASFRNLWALAKANDGLHSQVAFASAFYRLAYQGFATGVDNIGCAALAEARALGLRGHIGTVPHRLLASAIGLRGKLRLTGLLKGRD